MAIIYKITNKVNGKVYIGQTRTSLKERMSKHYSHSRVENVTGIDAAIKKYGKENFDIDIVEECPQGLLDEKERYYINYYNSYNEGYNLTLGGQDGLGTKKVFDVEIVKEKLKQYKTIKATAKELQCGDRTLSNFIKENNIPYNFKPKGKVENIIGKGKPFVEGDGVKAVHIIELDKTFPSLKECAQWLIDNGYSKAATMDAARKSLSRHLNGERATYLKMHFEFV